MHIATHAGIIISHCFKKAVRFYTGKFCHMQDIFGVSIVRLRCRRNALSRIDTARVFYGGYVVILNCPNKSAFIVNYNISLFFVVNRNVESSKLLFCN